MRELWQTEIKMDGQLVTNPGVAEDILRTLGVEYTEIEVESAEDGLYLVGFLGREARYLAADTEVWISEDLGGKNFQVYVPQP